MKCKYCQDNLALMEVSNGTLNIIGDELINTVTWDYYNDRPSDLYQIRVINYCPMCGRKLEAEK